MLAAEIPDGLIFGIIPVLLAGVLGLMGWMVRELSRISATNARTEARLEAGEQRMDDLHERVHQLEVHR